MTIEALNRLILSSGCFSGASLAGWTLDPAVLLPLALGFLLYVAGLARLWHSAGVGRGAAWWQVSAFLLGWLCMAAALASPLHDLSRRLFSAHMVEHELVMTIAAPLLVVSRPLGVLLWSFPVAWRRPLARASQTLAYLLGWDILSGPLVATATHALAIWVWHIPAIFDAALASEGLHWLQHLCFFVSAMFFWWSLLNLRRRAGIAIACLFVTGLHTGALGALLTLIRQPIYPLQARLAVAWGVDPLQDQQLAGLIMWIPAGFVYVAAGLAVAGLWIGRSSRWESSHARHV
jgi:cytochrome c oxidase assembly factor CtaG